MLVLVFLIVLYFPFKIVFKMLKHVYYMGSGKDCSFITDFKIKKDLTNPISKLLLTVAISKPATMSSKFPSTNNEASNAVDNVLKCISGLYHAPFMTSTKSPSTTDKIAVVNILRF